MKIFTSLALVLAVSGLSAQTPTTPPAPTAAQEAIESKVKEQRALDTKETAIKVVTSGLATGSPVAAVAQLATGFISNAIKTSVMKSEWQMTMTQKFAAKAMASYLSKREKEEYKMTNSKAGEQIILTIEAKSMTKEKSDSMLAEEPLVKWRKCGWDWLVFSNGTESWAYSTDGK